MNRIFMTHNKIKIDNIIQYLYTYIGQYDYDIYIGCDSQVKKYSTDYSVVICVRRYIDGIGRGVHVLHTIEKEKRYVRSKGSIFMRLWLEVEKTAETALFLKANGFTNLEIHIDANPKSAYESNKIHNSAIGYLKSLGFKNVFAKPDSFSATYASNFYVR